MSPTLLCASLILHVAPLHPGVHFIVLSSKVEQLQSFLEGNFYTPRALTNIDMKLVCLHRWTNTNNVGVRGVDHRPAVAGREQYSDIASLTFDVGSARD